MKPRMGIQCWLLVYQGKSGLRLESRESSGMWEKDIPRKWVGIRRAPSIVGSEPSQEQGGEW